MSELKATTIEGGFVLHLVGADRGSAAGRGTECLGKALAMPDDVVVEMEDERSLNLIDALGALLEGRTVAGFVVLTDPKLCRRTRTLRSLARRVGQTDEVC